MNVTTQCTNNASSIFHRNCPFHHLFLLLLVSISAVFLILFLLVIYLAEHSSMFLIDLSWIIFAYSLVYCIDWFLIDCCYCPHANVFPIKHTRLLVIILVRSISFFLFFSPFSLARIFSSLFHHCHSIIRIIPCTCVCRCHVNCHTK